MDYGNYWMCYTQNYIGCYYCVLNSYLLLCHAIRTNKYNSKFTQHFLETEHVYDMMNQTTEILHIEKNRPKLNTVERFYVYDLTKKVYRWTMHLRICITPYSTFWLHKHINNTIPPPPHFINHSQYYPHPPPHTTRAHTYIYIHRYSPTCNSHHAAMT
jgi:hypothetical protein